MPAKTFHILLVEDNPDDVLLIMRALRCTEYEIHVVRDGVQATAFLDQQEPYSGVPRPDLILLDLMLPKKDGRQVLADVRANFELKTVPVVVLTSLETEDESFKSYAGHASSYIRKSVNVEEFGKVVSHIVDLWLSSAQAEQV